ncbi:MAG: LPXTG cell wall anchor domain-containing protein [Acidobacteriia bacterium]|nr:LPXTG cell wall anchor domain-containing protein [Terriglobia bacterium]
MKSHSLFSVRMLVTTLCAIGIATGVVVFRAQADQWDKRTILTVNQPIQVRDTYLPAGQYVLKLLNSNSDRHIVQIFNGDQSHLIDTVLAINNYRLEPTGHSQFMFWETPPGTAKALRAWFYPGDNYGQEFPYPKHLQRIETASVTSAPAPVPSAAAPSRETVAPRQEETPAPVPAQPQAAAQEPQPERPVEVAQAAPPPTPAPQPPAQQPEPAPERLPKTGSPYPVIGLAGLVSLALYGLLRLKIMV